MSVRGGKSGWMSVSPDPILYSFRRCPYAIRARLALAVSGTSYELREVNLQAKPAAMLVVSSKATVPVLVSRRGEVIDQSLDIMRWALRRSDPECWLEREDAALIAANDGPFKTELDGYKYSDPNSEERLAHRERGLVFLRDIECRLSGRSQIGGSVRGLTDAALLPFIRQFAAVDRDWFERQAPPNLRRWLDWHLESCLFKAVMIRATVWSQRHHSTSVQGL